MALKGNTGTIRIKERIKENLTENFTIERKVAL